jgi:hypothetical protein
MKDEKLISASSLSDLSTISLGNEIARAKSLCISYSMRLDRGIITVEHD